MDRLSLGDAADLARVANRKTEQQTKTNLALTGGGLFLEVVLKLMGSPEQEQKIGQIGWKYR